MRTRFVLLGVLVIAALGAGAAPVAAQSQAGLVAAYGFEEGSGTSAADHSGNANHGTLSNVTWGANGRFGSALTFNGTSSLVSVADAESLDLTTAMTLEAWVNPSSLGGWRTVILKEQPNDLAYGLYADDDAGRSVTRIHTTGDLSAAGTGALALNSWTHLAATYSGSTLRLFVNGVQASTSTSASAIVKSTGALRIGGNNVWGEWFAGIIDEVRVYDRALTAAEIQADMTTAVSAGDPPSPPPPQPPPPPPPGAAQAGQWSAPISFPLVPVHMTPMANGRIAMWDGFSDAVNSETLFDPETQSFSPVPTGRNLFCAVNIKLVDGSVLSAGGHVQNAPLNDLGTKELNVYNPSTGQWTRGPDMARKRWYPSATTLADGRVFVISGDDISLQPFNPYPLVTASDTVPEIYDPRQNTWTPMPSAARRIPLYPHMFLLPDGRLFDAGPDQTTRTLDLSTGTWSVVGTSPVEGQSSVMYRPGKIVKSGTWSDADDPGRAVTNRAAAIDMTVPAPAWREVASMHHQRSYHTLTALPDGTVLASGGGIHSGGVDPADAVLESEIWDPATDSWTRVASSQRPRLYHSSAVLLQDGRVLLAGGGAFEGRAPNERNGEIYSPPYLFKGPRPTIAAAPATIGFGTSFSVDTPDAARIASVSLVRMGSVTHNVDADQRFMNLSFTRVPGGLTITGPSDANTAPPGIYQLFVLDDAGVPSIAKIVQLPLAPTDVLAPSAPTNVAADGELGAARLSWTAADDDVRVALYRVHRSTGAGFTPSAANRIATVATTSYRDASVTSGTYRYRLVAVDGAGNAGPASNEATANVPAGATDPSVSVTAPAGGTTVSGSSATASDDVGVSGAQFRLDGQPLAAEDTTAPPAGSATVSGASVASPRRRATTTSASARCSSASTAGRSKARTRTRRARRPRTPRRRATARARSRPSRATPPRTTRCRPPSRSRSTTPRRHEADMARAVP